MTTLERIKLGIRRGHAKLDEDLQSDIDFCLAELRALGIIYADETDPLIFNAIKLYCKSVNTDDPAKAAEWRQRYDALKGSLQIAEGYGWKAEEAVADE